MVTGLDSFLAGPVQALNLRNHRGDVLASNIANADTPNFKARDFDFVSALRAATGGAAPATLVKTSVRHLDGASALPVFGALQYRIPVQASIDGNTVELDTELANFTDNALRTQADLTVLANRFRLLQMAVAGQ